MLQLRAFLVSFANVIIVAGIIISTLTGFISGGGSTTVFGYFSFKFALLGAAVSFLVSCAAMTILAILLDIRDLLERIAQNGTRM